MCNESKIVCPNCKSNNVSDDSIKSNNGILGNGFKSWILKVQYVCNDCHIIFKPKENEKTY